MNLQEIYQNPRYKELADQVEALHEQMNEVFANLIKEFPPEGNRKWTLMGDGRPYIKSFVWQDTISLD